MIFGVGCVFLLIGVVIGQMSPSEKHVSKWRVGCEWVLVNLLILMNLSGVSPNGSIAASVVWVSYGLTIILNKLDLNHFANIQFLVFGLSWLLLCPDFWGNMYWI
jgi:hypothetical protein